MKNNLVTIGRIIFALAIAFFGIGHLTNANAMASTMVPSFLSGIGVPLVYVTGICLLGAAVSFIINWYTYWAGILLSVFLILVGLLVHIPQLSDPSGQQVAMSILVRDSAIAGAALIIAGIGRS